VEKKCPDRTRLSGEGPRRARVVTLVPHLFGSAEAPGQSERVRVCITMLLTTFGFKKTNNWPLKFLHLDPNGDAEALHDDKRGRHTPKHALSDEVREQIAEHVESFHPQVSHYRRETAPNRRYLPADITVKFMWNDYCEQYAGVSYYTYAAAVRKAGITFCILGNEECETCAELKHEHAEFVDGCEVCDTKQNHKTLYTAAREEYQKDKSSTRVPGRVVVSADLMKVFMLPKMPFKVAIFTPRVVVFNETFSPLESSCVLKGAAVVWDESTAGEIFGRQYGQLVLPIFARPPRLYQCHHLERQLRCTE
jgi:hypothetical protein